MEENAISAHEKIMRELKEWQDEELREYYSVEHSYDVDSIKKELLRRGYKKENIITNYLYPDADISIKLFVDNNFIKKVEDLKIFIKNLCKWEFVSASDEENNPVEEENILTHNSQIIHIKYKNKFELENHCHDNFIYLYHLAPINCSEKIKKIGLVPSSKNKMFSNMERVYFSDSIDDLITLSQIFFHTNEKLIKSKENKEGTVSKNYVIFRIDYKSPLFANRLFKCPRSKDGFYTMENVNPEIIESFIEIELDDKGEVFKIQNL